jgi:hypothetical protein
MLQPLQQDSSRDKIRQSFAKESAYFRISSPLFSTLATASAADDDIIEIVSATRPGQSSGLLIFYVVHYLLLKSPEPRLAQYFPSLTEHAKPATEAFPAFKEYCLAHRHEITELLSWRTVNTNLPEKASCLVPALRHVERLSGGSLTLVELCCSAGLNMLFDEYHYDYGSAGQLGPESSPVHLQCKIIGPEPPPIDTMPRVTRRVGVDLVKVDPNDALQQLWMEAVLCPEWKQERARLKAALALRAQQNLEIIEGDALRVVPSLLETLPGNLCILMSYCIGHWSQAARAELDELLRRASHHRTIHRLSVEMPDSEPAQTARTRLARLAAAHLPMLQKSSPSRIDYTGYEAGEVRTRLLGQGDCFGLWLDWEPSG